MNHGHLSFSCAASTSGATHLVTMLFVRIGCLVVATYQIWKISSDFKNSKAKMYWATLIFFLTPDPNPPQAPQTGTIENEITPDLAWHKIGPKFFSWGHSPNCPPTKPTTQSEITSDLVWCKFRPKHCSWDWKIRQHQIWIDTNLDWKIFLGTSHPTAHPPTHPKWKDQIWFDRKSDPNDFLGTAQYQAKCDYLI